MFVNIFASGGCNKCSQTFLLQEAWRVKRMMVGIFCSHLAAKRSKARTRSICGMFSAKRNPFRSLLLSSYFENESMPSH